MSKSHKDELLWWTFSWISRLTAACKPERGVLGLLRVFKVHFLFRISPSTCSNTPTNDLQSCCWSDLTGNSGVHEWNTKTQPFVKGTFLRVFLHYKLHTETRSRSKWVQSFSIYLPTICHTPARLLLECVLHVQGVLPASVDGLQMTQHFVTLPGRFALSRAGWRFISLDSFLRRWWSSAGLMGSWLSTVTGLGDLQLSVKPAGWNLTHTSIRQWK